MHNTILVVEDETDIADLVAFSLRSAGHRVDIAHTGEEASRRLQAGDYELVVLDVMLPDTSGVELCRRIRRNDALAHTGVLMLTARGEEVDRVVGFEVGADDYMVKPFSPRELVLRASAILRRVGGPPERESSAAPAEVRQSLNTHTLGKLVVDIDRHRVTVGKHEIPLTALEFRLLLFLLERRGRVHSRDALLEAVWGYAAGTSTRTVDTHVKRLREKLLEASDYIETIRGVGYRMREGV